MEIYVSEKEKKFDSYSLIGYYHKKIDSRTILENNTFSDECEDLPLLEVKSLEQHDKELMNEFAEELKTFLLDYGTIEQANIISVIDKLLKERGKK